MKTERSGVSVEANARDSGRDAEAKMFFSQWSFKQQITLAFVVGFFFLAVAFSVYQVISQSTYLYRDSTDDTISLAETLAASSRSWVLANDVVGLQEVVHAFQSHPELRYVMVISPSGRVLAHSDATKVGQFVSDETSLALMKAPPRRQVMTDNESMIDIAVPIMVDSRHVGWARAAQNREGIVGNLRNMTLAGALFVLTAVVLSLLAALFIANRLGYRIGYLMRVAEAVQAGNYARRADISGGDEIARLAGSFNHMLDVLARDEEQLRAASIYTRSLIEASLDPLVTISPQGKITDVNDATERVTGRHRSELTGTDFSDYFTEPDKAREGYQQVFMKGSVTDYPLALRHRDGHVTDVLYNASIYRDAAGEVLGVFAAARDITEYKRAEASRMQLAAIVESSNDAIIGKTPDGIITSWNKAAEKIYGYVADEIIGKSVTTLALSSRHAEMHELLGKVRNGGTVTNHESERIRKDGALIHVALTLSPIRDSSGNVTGISTIARDITERKRAEVALRSSETRFRLLIENSPFCIHEIGMDGRISSMNKAGLVMMGVEEECKVQGFLYLDAVCDADRARIGELLARAYAGEASYFEFKASGPAGLIFKSCFVPIKNQNGGVEKLMGITEDITERKNAEFVLRQSEEGLKEAQRIAHLGSWYLDIATNQIYWSEELYKMYGFDPALPPPLYTESMKLFTPESWERLSNAIAQAAEKGIPYELELEMVRINGNRGWMLARGEQVRDEHGAAVRVRGVAMDITERKRTDEALHENEHFLDSLIEHLPNMLFVKDAKDLKFVRFNKAGEALLGYARNELIGKSDYDFFPKEQADFFISKDREIIARREMQDMPEEPISTKFLGQRYLHTRKIPVFADDGSPLYLLGISEDITERKLAEGVLREKEERLALATANNGVGVWDWNLVTQEMIWDDSMYALYHIRREDFIGTEEAWRASLHPDDLARGDQEVADAISGKKPFETEFRVVWPNGETRHIKAVAKVFRDDRGTPLRMLGINMDVTDRRKAEMELRELNNDFVTLLENTGDFIYFKDKDSRIRFCSQTLASITGHQSWRDMIGKHDLEIFPKDTARIYYEEELPIFREGKALLNKTDPYYDEQGKTGWVNTNKWPVFGDDKKTVVGIFGISRDITELKEADDKINELNRNLEQRVAERTGQLEAANKELEAFSYSVSHDLRTPLRAIDGFSHILLEDYTDKLDDEGKRLLSVVRDNTSRMGQLIDDILKFSRAGRLEINFSEIDMENMAHEVYEELRPAAGHELQVEIGHLPSAMGDRAMMHQVFVNLLSNAIKFTRARADARIEVGSSAGENETVYFVKDNGAGFDMQYVGKLFGVFQRLHSVNEFEGTGIGLAIVKRIVNRHGGRVWAEGKINEGATIYFTLPNKEQEHE